MGPSGIWEQQVARSWPAAATAGPPRVPQIVLFVSCYTTVYTDDGRWDKLKSVRRRARSGNCKGVAGTAVVGIGRSVGCSWRLLLPFDTYIYGVRSKVSLQILPHSID